MKEIQAFLDTFSVKEFKQGLSEWTPRSNEAAGTFLAWRSAMSGKDADAAKEAANARLLGQCDKCDFLEFPGFKLKPVFKNTREYGDPTKKLIDLQLKAEKMKKQLKELEIDIKAEIDKAPFTEGEPVFSHWLVQ